MIVHLYQTNHNNLLLVFGNKNTDSSRSHIILCPQGQNNRNFKWKFPSCFDLLWRFCEDFSNHMERFLSHKAHLCESYKQWKMVVWLNTVWKMIHRPRVKQPNGSNDLGLNNIGLKMQPMVKRPRVIRHMVGQKVRKTDKIFERNSTLFKI